MKDSRNESYRRYLARNQSGAAKSTKKPATPEKNEKPDNKTKVISLSSLSKPKISESATDKTADNRDPKNPNARVIRSPHKKKTKRFTRSRKGPSAQKTKPADIMEIEAKVNRMLSEMQSHKKKHTKPETEKKPVIIPEKKPKTPEPEKKPVKEPEKPKPKPKPLKKPKRDLTRRNKRPTKGNQEKPKPKQKAKKIRIKKKAITKEDIKEIEKKIDAIRTKKPKDIKEALAKEGIQVSGKSNRLLKDIYFYSKVCNINITHEK